MRRPSSEYYNCGYHKMCDVCRQRFASLGGCPLCGKCNQRCIEKSVGRCSVIPSTYIPESMPSVLEAPCPQEEEIFASSSSDSSLLTSLSSNDMVLSDSDEGDSLTYKSRESCNDDPFACLDAAYEASQSEYIGNSGLLHCGFSLYNPPSHCDTFCSDVASSKDVTRNSSEDSGKKRVGVLSTVDAKRTLQKTKRISSEDLQRIVELCKDITL